MPKHRFPPTPRSNKRRNKKVPETADEFLDVGIEHEESGDRWRPGDKLKAGRFYQRALDGYSAALQLNPTSFDAAYNLARLQYQLAQHPELTGGTHHSSRLLLKTAVDSHRRCLALDPSNEDALFNTGQVLCSFAEALSEYRAAPIEAKTEAAQLLVEAVETLQRCLALQEAQYAALQAQTQQTGDDIAMDGAPETGAEEAHDSMDEAGAHTQWAIVQPPTTPTTLLDTSLAALTALTTLLPLNGDGLGPPLPHTLAAAHALLDITVPPLAHATGRHPEIALARANLLAASAEAAFRAGGPAAAWEAGIRAAFDGLEGVQAMCDHADAHIQLAGTVDDAAVAWRHYALAAQILAGAAGLEPARGEIHVARGDVELLRARLEGVEAAARSRGVLLRNAGVYYRGARRLGGGAEGEAAVKERMVAFEEGGGGGGEGAVLAELVGGGEAVKEIVVEAVEEGLFGAEWLGRVGAGSDAAPGGLIAGAGGSHDA